VSSIAASEDAQARFGELIRPSKMAVRVIIDAPYSSAVESFWRVAARLSAVCDVFFL
jgi:hypothetical protein